MTKPNNELQSSNICSCGIPSHSLLTTAWLIMLVARPADKSQSSERALDFLNAKFPTLDSAESIKHTAVVLLEQHNELQREVGRAVKL